METRSTQVLESGAEVPWSTAQKVAFRFAFVYLCLYLYPFSSTLGWYWSIWLRWGYHETPWQQLVPWVAEHLLHVGRPVTPNPMSDSLYMYVKVLCLALIAGLVTVIWSIADRKRPT